MPSLRTGLLVLAALVAAAVVVVQTATRNEKAHAQVTGSVAIRCEFLADAIDGNTEDANPVFPDADFIAACTGGLSAAEIDAIAGDCDGDGIAGEAVAVCATGSGATVENGLGDNDGKLEASDMSAVDLDGNQITDGGGSSPMYAIAFVNNDGTVTFDAQFGLTVTVNPSGDAATDPAAPVDDLNPETCGVNEGLDFDCGNTILSNGDGVIVATLTEVSAPGATINVDISQSGGAFAVSTQAISIVAAGTTPTPGPTGTPVPTGTAVIGCEFLAGAIDGNIDDANPISGDADFIAACTGGLSAAEIDAIAGDCDGDNVAGEAVAVCATGSGAVGENGIGDNDGKLEASDFAGIDLDANQIADGGGSPATYAIAFVNNDGTVTLDSQVGLTVAVSGDGCTGVAAPGCPASALDPAAPADDLNSETCGVNEGLDFDCGNTVLSNGDGVVVATLSEVSTAGTSINVVISQGTDVSNQTISIVGAAFGVTIAAVETVIQTNSTSTLANTCINQADVNNSSQVSEPNKTFVKATVTDNAGRDLTRADVDFITDSATISRIDDDASETGVDPRGQTGISVDRGAGVFGAFAVVCGGPGTGTALISAEINNDTVSTADDKTASVPIAVVGLSAQVQIQSDPTQFVCDGLNTSEITATIRDATGAFVADGTPVNFSVTSVGIVNPINTTTVSGIASTTFTGFSGFSVGVPVIVTSGSAQSSILMFCLGFDTDGDGMPNVFETAHVCLNQAVADATGDPDVDAVASLSEYQRALNPCVADSDADGCEDGAEIAPDPLFGGDRNPLDPWDFYDVNGTKSVTLSDTLLILEHFGHAHNGDPVDPGLDRYVPDSLKPWRSAEALNGITLADALANLLSFGHSCAPPP